MISLAEQVSNGLRSFLNQRDDLVLVLQAADSDVPAGLKIIEAVEAELGHVLGWTFAQSFTDPHAYADAVVKDLAQKQAVITASLRQRGETPPPPMPEALRDPARPPVERLRGAVGHVRSLMPPAAAAVTLFALVPLKIADGKAYGALAGELVRHRLPFPWCAGVRFVVRDDAARPALAALAVRPRTRLLRADFSPAALAAAAEREAADATLPKERRAAAATVAAGVHQGNRRPLEAEPHYLAAFEHYGASGNAAMAAVAANGIAACRQAQGDVAGAERIMQAALEASLEATPPALPVTLNILLDLTLLVARQGRWEEVELYARATRDVAGVLLRPGIEAEALHRRAIAQLRQDDAAAAEESWREAIRVADASEEGAQRLTARTHLVRLLERSGRADEARPLAAEIGRLRQAANAAGAPAQGASA